MRFFSFSFLNRRVYNGSMKRNTIIIYTDGSSLGNPGPGGWGAIVLEDDVVTELGGKDAHTTNNRMELTGAIRALAAVNNKKGDIILHTDSRYVINGITQWIPEWEKRNWMTKAKKPVENRDLWEELSRLVKLHNMEGTILWKHVGGHVGITGNERVDEIATSFAEGKIPKLYRGPVLNYAYDLSNTKAFHVKRASRATSKVRSRAKAFSYLSLVDGVFKRHATWAECEKRVKGVRGAKFKKVLSAEEEKMIRTDWGV
jgi:ribonuclease HI